MSDIIMYLLFAGICYWIFDALFFVYKRRG